jgi:hypothetical protein
MDCPRIASRDEIMELPTAVTVVSVHTKYGS